MKRRSLVGSIGLSSIVVVTGVLGTLSGVGCGPVKEPTQASAPDPLTDDANDQSSSKAVSSGDSNAAPASKSGVNAAGGKGDAAQAGNLGGYLEGLHWGMSHADVNKVYTQTNGIIWKDYDEKLSKARVGPEMTALESEREQQKGAFTRSYIEFKDTPTGYDTTGIKNEYTYRNKEALMWVQRQGKKRYFFFINDRLWKIYDEVPLSASGMLGANFVDAVNTTVSKVGTQGRILQADPAKGVYQTTVDWKDATNHLRVVDRSGEGVVGVSVEDQATMNSLAQLRANKAEDPTAIDPTILAVTKGGLSDPNAAQPAASGSAAPGKKAPAKKK